MARGLSPKEFALDLKKFGAVAEEDARLIFRKIIIDLDTAVVLGTPVDTGRARGNWFASLTSPSNAATDTPDKSGSRALAGVNRTASEAQVGDIAWLTNNLPYILVLENGSSRQAPQGMVDQNLHRIAAQFGGAIKR